jgi:hypothetical protein
VVGVHPERGGVEPVPVGLAEAADSSEVADEPERSASIVAPGDAEERGHIGNSESSLVLLGCSPPPPGINEPHNCNTHI